MRQANDLAGRGAAFAVARAATTGRGRAGGAGGTAPWELEGVNVLRTACARGRMTAQHAQQVLARIAQLPIEIDRQALA